ncbi:hypothetical protein ABIB81_007540 [Bradyrhizobium sp. I1.7.5]
MNERRRLQKYLAPRSLLRIVTALRRFRIPVQLFSLAAAQTTGPQHAIKDRSAKDDAPMNHIHSAVTETSPRSIPTPLLPIFYLSAIRCQCVKRDVVPKAPFRAFAAKAPTALPAQDGPMSPSRRDRMLQARHQMKGFPPVTATVVPEV